MKKCKALRNSKGIATIEILILFVVFIVFSSYSLGFFGVVHTGIKNSIAARAFAFEQYRNRANVTYWRDNVPSDISHYKNRGWRTAGIVSETWTSGQDQARLYSSARQIAFVRNPEFQRTAVTGDPTVGWERQEANAVYIKTKYGICLNAKCGGSE